MAKKAAKKAEAPVAEPSPKTAFEQRIGISSESLKKVFDTPALEDGPKKLRNLLSARLKQSRYKNFAEYRIYAAIDDAYNVAFNQTTNTMVNAILGRRWGSDLELLDAVKQWGLDEDLFFDCTSCNTGKQQRMRKRPTLSKINIPLVKSFVTIRLGKLFNDRNQYPLFKYEPVQMTAEESALCEILTQVVQRFVAQYGYQTYLKQAILQTLLYSMALMFPSEVWHVDWAVDEKGNKYPKKEGLRYQIPHPTRMGYDLNYMPSTFNTDSGCEWACYWRVCRLSDVQDNPNYFNTTNIPVGTNWFSPNFSGAYFTEFYPCQAPPPRAIQNWPNDREDQAAYYATGDADKAIFLTDMFAKVIPKTHGLGDYDQPVWFRFVLASDDTVIWAEPIPYCPVLFCGYDFDENRGRNPSMALEVLPSQDQISNLQTQIIGAAKQNLAKVVPYDTDQVDRDTIEKLHSQGETINGITFLPYSSKMAKVAGVDPAKMFNPIQFPLQSVVELVTAQNTIVSMLERLLGMSSNEVGAAGVHVQTAEEIRVINTNISNRLEFTGVAVDLFMQAWKVQLYEASRAFMDEEFVAQVSDSPDYVKPLRDLGFELGEPFNGTVQVKGDRSKLVVGGFVSQREGQNRINQPQVAQVMMQTLQAAAGNPEFLRALGVKQYIDQLNRAAELAGAPKDFKLRVVDQTAPGQPGAVPSGEGESPGGAAPGLAQVAQQIEQAAVKEAMNQIGQGIQPLVQRVGEAEKAIQDIGQGEKQSLEMLAQLKQALEQLAVNQQKIMQAASMAPPVPAPSDVPPSGPMGPVPPPAPVGMAPVPVGGPSPA
jgi:hypothetical protein